MDPVLALELFLDQLKFFGLPKYSNLGFVRDCLDLGPCTDFQVQAFH